MAGNTIRFSAWLDDKVSGPLAKVRDNFDRLGKSKGFLAVAQGVGVGAGISAYNLLDTAISTTISTISNAIGDASDLNETLAKSAVVFGDSADEVEAWGDTLAQSFGISKQAGIEAAASFGNVFTNLDFADDKAAEMSQTMVQLAGDLASFNNLATDDALQKLRAGLAGEAEPLRAVGVFLTEAKVKAKAMELGLAGAHGELSEGAKITARYQLILEETASAQGDFERTSDGLANTQRTLNATMEDLSATLGNELLPHVATVAQALVIVTGAAKDASGETDNFSASVSQAIGTVANMQIPLLSIIAGLEDWKAALDEAGDESRQADDRERRRIISLLATERATREAGEATSQIFVPSLKQIAKWADEADDAVSDLAESIADELYGDTIRAGEEADLQGTIRDLQKELERTTNKRDAKVLAGQLAEAKKELFLLHLEQAEAGGPTAMLQWLRRAERAIGDDDEEMRGLLAHTRAMLDLSGKLPNTIKVTYHDPTLRGERAAGGPVQAGEAYIVGEKGPEYFVPRESGYIVANSATSPSPMGWSGGEGITLPVTVMLDGDVIYRSVEQRQARQLRLAPTRT